MLLKERDVVRGGIHYNRFVLFCRSFLRNYSLESLGYRSELLLATKELIRSLDIVVYPTGLIELNE